MLKSVRQKLSPDDVQVILYHHNCTDGLMAAAIGVMYGKQHDKVIEVWGLDHGKDRNGENPSDEVIKLVKDKNVLIVDYCPSKKHLHMLIALAKNLLVLDHHKSAMEECKDVSACYFDMGFSGAGLSWMYFYDTPMPLAVQYVQDRDLWTWKIPESKSFCFSFYPAARNIIACLEVIMSFDAQIHVQRHIERGIILIKHIDETLANAVKRPGKEITLANNDKLILINATEYISDMGDKMAQNYDYVAMFTTEFDRDTNSWKYRISFRSRNGKDCTKVAGLIGGGGHPGAAGGNWKGTLEELEKKLMGPLATP